MYIVITTRSFFSVVVVGVIVVNDGTRNEAGVILK